MTTITRHTCAHIAPAALVAGGSVVAGVVMAARHGGATVFPGVSCKKNKKKPDVSTQSAINPMEEKTQ